MLDYLKLHNYTENNRIEAKKALGGLPESIWETYSAFANTLGGVILLGVIENKDKTLSPVGLPEPQALVDAFLKRIEDKSVASVNVLKDGDVSVKDVNGKKIVVIKILPAPKNLLPVYVGGDVFNGCYIRNGEGDFKLTKDQVREVLKGNKIPFAVVEAAALKSLEKTGKACVNRLIVEFLTKNVEAGADKIAKDCELPEKVVKNSLELLIKAKIIVEIEKEEGLRYRLKR